MESAAECGSKWRVWFAKLIRNTSLWRTAQHSLFEDLEQSLAIWPRWEVLLGAILSMQAVALTLLTLARVMILLMPERVLIN